MCVVLKGRRNQGELHVKIIKIEWTDELLNEALKLVKGGKSAHEAAIVMGVSRNMILGAFHRNGIKITALRPALPPPPPPPPKTRKLIHNKKHIKYEPYRERRPIMIDDSKPCPILELRYGICRWPLWEFHTPQNEKLYCGAPCDGKVYCTRHNFIATQRERPRSTGMTLRPLRR